MVVKERVRSTRLLYFAAVLTSALPARSSLLQDVHGLTLVSGLAFDNGRKPVGRDAALGRVIKLTTKCEVEENGLAWNKRRVTPEVIHLRSDEIRALLSRQAHPAT